MNEKDLGWSCRYYERSFIIPLLLADSVSVSPMMVMMMLWDDDK